MTYRDDAIAILDEVKDKFPEAAASTSVMGDVELDTKHGPLRLGNWGGREDIITIFPGNCRFDDPYGVTVHIGHDPDDDEEIIDMIRLALMRTARVERRRHGVSA